MNINFKFKNILGLLPILAVLVVTSITLISQIPSQATPPIGLYNCNTPPKAGVPELLNFIKPENLRSYMNDKCVMNKFMKYAKKTLSQIDTKNMKNIDKIGVAMFANADKINGKRDYIAKSKLLIEAFSATGKTGSRDWIAVMNVFILGWN
jgi:hypothetical protein